MIKDWGIDYEVLKSKIFHEDNGDRIFSFNSNKKRSSVIITRADGTVRLYCKGASEWVLKDCTHILEKSGSVTTLSPVKTKEIEDYIEEMAKGALRTLVLAHRDFPNATSLPDNWAESPPDSSDLIFDCVVGIIDPLREDVTDAVKMVFFFLVFLRVFFIDKSFINALGSTGWSYCPHVHWRQLDNGMRYCETVWHFNKKWNCN